MESMGFAPIAFTLQRCCSAIRTTTPHAQTAGQIHRLSRPALSTCPIPYFRHGTTASADYRQAVCFRYLLADTWCARLPSPATSPVSYDETATVSLTPRVRRTPSTGVEPANHISGSGFQDQRGPLLISPCNGTMYREAGQQNWLLPVLNPERPQRCYPHSASGI